MKKYLVTLSNEIRRHKLIKADGQLKAKKWNKTCFDRCAKIMHESLDNLLNEKERVHLGTSISYKTIQAIFNHEYRIKYPMDPRSLNTLTKLVRFIGYNSWDDFIADVDRSEDLDQLDSEDQADLLTFVREAVRTSFDALYKQSSNGPLNSYFDAKQSAFKELEDVINHNKKSSNIISNPYNPSTYEILDLKIESVSDVQATVKTNEYWLLCWWNTDTEKYVKRVKDINDHQYVLTKGKSGWRIKTDATLSDKF